MRPLFTLSFVLIASLSQYSFAFDIETIATAESDVDIVKLLSSPIGAVYENSNKLKNPSCLIAGYPSKLAAFTAVGFQLKKVRLASTEFFYQTHFSGIYFQERLTLYFSFEKEINGKRVSEETQINCATNRTRPESGSYK